MKTPIQDVVLLFVGLIGIIIASFYLSDNVKPFQEVCPGEKGMMTIDPNGHVAEHLVKEPSKYCFVSEEVKK